MPIKSRQPVGVIGGSEAAAEVYNVARQLGIELAIRGLPVICGGRTGVMEGVCEGCAEAGGVSIGVLPERDINKANKHCTIVLPTDLGNATHPLISEKTLGTFHRVSRNRVIVASSLCVFVVSGSAEGTGDEVRFALDFKMRAFGLCRPAAPIEHPNIWEEGAGGLFSIHGTVAEAMKAFERDYPLYKRSR